MCVIVEHGFGSSRTVIDHGNGSDAQIQLHHRPPKRRHRLWWNRRRRGSYAPARQGPEIRRENDGGRDVHDIVTQ